jgi:hypothetical protein
VMCQTLAFTHPHPNPPLEGEGMFWKPEALGALL